MFVWTQVEFLSASKEINARPDVYWQLVMDIARENNLKRILRCCTIMGRSESDELSAAQIMYPCMQCADIFFLGVGCPPPLRGQFCAHPPTPPLTHGGGVLQISLVCAISHDMAKWLSSDASLVMLRTCSTFPSSPKELLLLTV